MKENVIKEKSFDFAVRIYKLNKYLQEEKKEYILSKQLLRSGTSIGANVSEAVQAISKADFRAKMSIALKEASETEYWLRLLKAVELLTKVEFDSVCSDCAEIEKILVSILKSLKK